MLRGIQRSRTNGRGLINRAHARRPADRIASFLSMRGGAARPRVLISPWSDRTGGELVARGREADCAVKRRPWWPKRGGPTRSLPEHGRETPQRQRYCAGNGVGQSADARASLDPLLLGLPY